MGDAKRLPEFDAELRAAGITLFAGLPYYGPDGRRDHRVSLHRLPLRWAVSREFWDNHLAGLVPDDTRLDYGGWPVEVVDGPPGEWVQLREAMERLGKAVGG